MALMVTESAGVGSYRGADYHRHAEPSSTKSA
jgi:hypothetical protein